MALLFIGSTGDQAGHTLFTWAILKKMLEKGLRPGFFKPFGTESLNFGGSWIDHDAILFKEVLNLDEPLERICPYMATDKGWRTSSPSQILEKCRELSLELSRKKDILVVMGSRHIFFDDTFWPVPDMNLVAGLKANFILLNRFRKSSSSLYSIFFAYSLVRDLMKAAVINRAPPEKLDEVRDRVLLPVTIRGIKTAAVIAEDPPLSLWSLREIADELSASVLWGDEQLDRKVWRMAIGSLPLKGKSPLFKMVYNKITLIGSLTVCREEDTEPASAEIIAGILLTGGVKPPPQLIDAAAAEKIPLLLVEVDTFSAMERLERSPHRLSSKNESKVDHFCELLNREQRVLDRLIGDIADETR
jgi:BioD-like phosphotransacetylase family protein